jgi:hypothetical protein
MGYRAREASVKRLTLDLRDEVHKHLKVAAAQLEVPMAELLRELVADAISRPTVLDDTAARIRDRGKATRK